MKPTVGILAVMAVLLADLSQAQDTRVSRYVFSPGVAISSGGNAAVRGVLGQTFVGAAGFDNTMLEAGFFVDTLFRSVVVGVEESGDLPLAFALEQNYPNPFNPTTVIRFALPVRARVSVKLYNLLGQDVMTVVDEERTPGFHQVALNAQGLASGVYVYRMISGDFIMTRKLIVLR